MAGVLRHRGHAEVIPSRCPEGERCQSKGHRGGDDDAESSQSSLTQEVEGKKDQREPLEQNPQADARVSFPRPICEEGSEQKNRDDRVEHSPNRGDHDRVRKEHPELKPSKSESLLAAPPEECTVQEVPKQSVSQDWRLFEK